MGRPEYCTPMGLGRSSQKPQHLGLRWSFAPQHVVNGGSAGVRVFIRRPSTFGAGSVHVRGAVVHRGRGTFHGVAARVVHRTRVLLWTNRFAPAHGRSVARGPRAPGSPPAPEPCGSRFLPVALGPSPIYRWRASYSRVCCHQLATQRRGAWKASDQGRRVARQRPRASWARCSRPSTHCSGAWPSLTMRSSVSPPAGRVEWGQVHAYHALHRCVAKTRAQPSTHAGKQPLCQRSCRRPAAPPGARSGAPRPGAGSSATRRG